ncbi:hypothetical protein BH10PSE10_BH10PSE10_09230 [soil metagenome]
MSAQTGLCIMASFSRGGAVSSSLSESELPPVPVDDLAAVAADELKEWGGRVLKIIFQTIPAPIILSIAVWRLYSGPLSEMSCSFVADRRLLRLWPQNLNYLEQLRDSPFSQTDQCWFLAVTSTTSALYVCWLCWVICRCVFVLGQIQHVRGTAKFILPNIWQRDFSDDVLFSRCRCASIDSQLQAKPRIIRP